MADEGELSYQELEANLAEYSGQLKQVEGLLLGDPENGELSEMYDSLTEVIQLTTELLSEARAQHAADTAAAAGGASGSGAPASSSSAAAAPAAPPALATRIVTAPKLALPSILPESVAQQIRKAQVRAAILGQADAAWAIGAKVLAKYSADGQFYTATVDAVTSTGKFVVAFDGYVDKEEVDLDSIKPTEEVETVYQGVAAPKRKRVDETAVVDEMPKWLVINEGDDEKTIARKKKLIKSHKSKKRFQNMDMASKEKADSWNSFISGKGKKKKTGTLVGTKKQSMFSVPDGGKVGVIGSGRGLTDYQKAGKHQFAPTDE